MENIVQADCQRSIAKSGYTSNSILVESDVNHECQHVNTDLGDLPFEF